MFSYPKFEELCKQNNVTPYRVSMETGVATATLTSWKQGAYCPKIEKINEIAKYFGVSVSEFIEEDGD